MYNLFLCLRGANIFSNSLSVHSNYLSRKPFLIQHKITFIIPFFLSFFPSLYMLRSQQVNGVDLNQNPNHERKNETREKSDPVDYGSLINLLIF